MFSTLKIILRRDVEIIKVRTVSWKRLCQIN